MLGSALTSALERKGHSVRPLVRREARTAQEVSWNPAAGELDPAALKDIDAVVNLSGAPLIQLPRRWTRSFIEQLYASRIGPTRTLALAIQRADNPPQVFLSQSGTGIYGAQDEPQDESGPVGEGILADLCAHWEEATTAARQHSRVVRMRTGVVFGPRGGALAKLLVPMKLGLGGKLGSGEQFWPWICQPDLLAAMQFLLEQPISGPVNLASPEAANVDQVVTELARALAKPHRLSVPAFALELGLSKPAAREVLLTSTKATPAVLLGHGFEFGYPGMAEAADWVASQLKTTS